MCTKCSILYNLEDCTVKSWSDGKCSFVEFPDHPQRSCRAPCGNVLMKKVKYVTRSAKTDHIVAATKIEIAQ